MYNNNSTKKEEEIELCRSNASVSYQNIVSMNWVYSDKINFISPKTTNKNITLKNN